MSGFYGAEARGATGGDPGAPFVHPSQTVQGGSSAAMGTVSIGRVETINISSVGTINISGSGVPAGGVSAGGYSAPPGSLSGFILPGGGLGAGGAPVGAPGGGGHAHAPSFMQAFLEHVAGGIPGIGGSGGLLSAGELGPVAGAAAAAYALHVATQVGEAAMAPALNLTALSSEGYAAGPLQALGGVPIIGAPFSMAAQRLQALDQIRNTAGLVARQTGTDPADVEAMDYGHGRTWRDRLYDMSPIAWLTGTGHPLRGAQADAADAGGVLGESQRSQARAMLVGANPGMSNEAVNAAISQAERQSDRPEDIMGILRTTSDLSAARAHFTSTADRFISGAPLSGQDAYEEASRAAAGGDVAATMRVIQEANSTTGRQASPFDSGILSHLPFSKELANIWHGTHPDDAPKISPHQQIELTERARDLQFLGVQGQIAAAATGKVAEQEAEAARHAGRRCEISRLDRIGRPRVARAD